MSPKVARIKPSSFSPESYVGSSASHAAIPAARSIANSVLGICYPVLTFLAGSSLQMGEGEGEFKQQIKGPTIPGILGNGKTGRAPYD